MIVPHPSNIALFCDRCMMRAGLRIEEIENGLTEQATARGCMAQATSVDNTDSFSIRSDIQPFIDFVP